MKYLVMSVWLVGLGVGCGRSMNSSSEAAQELPPEITSERLKEVSTRLLQKTKDHSIVSFFVATLAREYSENGTEPVALISKLDSQLKINCQSGRDCSIQKTGE